MAAVVPGMSLIFDSYRVTGPLGTPTFTPLWRSTANFQAANYLTFYFLSQRQILEADATYAFLIGSGVEENTPTVAQDFQRLRLAITATNTRPDTYEIRRESQFGVAIARGSGPKKAATLSRNDAIAIGARALPNFRLHRSG